MGTRNPGYDGSYCGYYQSAGVRSRTSAVVVDRSVLPRKSICKFVRKGLHCRERALS